MSGMIFIRHGQTDMAGRFCGHSDPHLNAEGELQAACAAKKIEQVEVQRLFSSDLRRASRTAEIIGQHIGIQPEIREDLREINFGSWEGLDWQQTEARFPLESKRWMHEFPNCSAPQGEAHAAFRTRIETAIGPLLHEAESSTVAVVTHRGVICHALTRFFGFSENEAWIKTEPYGAVVSANLRSEKCGCRES
jgi:alpha-ribazole phosphatase/probable phosphoglycerate mutase